MPRLADVLEHTDYSSQTTEPPHAVDSYSRAYWCDQRPSCEPGFYVKKTDKFGCIYSSCKSRSLLEGKLLTVGRILGRILGLPHLGYAQNSFAH